MKFIPSSCRLRSSYAFTLIEVVVVVAILAILMVAVVLPGINRVREDSTLASARGTAKTLMDAMQRTKILAGERWSYYVPGNVRLTDGADPIADRDAAVQFYYDNGLIREMPPLDNIAFIGGEWQVVIP